MRKTLVAILAVAGSISTVAFAAEREIKVDARLDAFLRRAAGSPLGI